MCFIYSPLAGFYKYLIKVGIASHVTTATQIPGHKRALLEIKKAILENKGVILGIKVHF